MALLMKEEACNDQDVPVMTLKPQACHINPLNTAKTESDEANPAPINAERKILRWNVLIMGRSVKAQE